MRKNFYETSIGFERNNKKQLTLRKGYIILNYMKKCIKCGSDNLVGTIFHPNHCLSCVVDIHANDYRNRKKNKNSS